MESKESHFGLQMGNCPIPVAEDSGLNLDFQKDQTAIIKILVWAQSKQVPNVEKYVQTPMWKCLTVFFLSNEEWSAFFFYPIFTLLAIGSCSIAVA